MGGILSFLGGTAFRWLFGEALDFLKRKQELANELSMLQLQHQLDRDKHQWQQEAIKAQAELGIKVIEAKRESDRESASDAAFLAAIEGVNEAQKRKDWIGAWNAAIRPLLATVAIFSLFGESMGWLTLSALFAEVSCAVLGVFVGERIRRNGK